MNLIGSQNSLATPKTSLKKSNTSQKINPNDNITNKTIENNSNQSESFTNIKK